MLFNTTGSLVYQGCLWLTTVLVVTLSGAYTGSGILAFAMAVGNMFNPIATYSMRTYQVSDITGQYGQSNYVAFRIVTELIGLAFIVPYALVVSPDLPTITTTLLYLFFKVDEAFVDVLYGVDQKAQRMDYIGISQFLRGVLLISGFSAGVAALGSLDAAVLFMFAACFAITVFYDIPHARRFESIVPHATRAQVLTLLRSCSLFVVGTLFLGAIVSVARQYYGVAFGVDALGLYAAVATPAVIIQAMARFLYSPVLVPLAERWNNETPDVFSHYLSKTIAVIVVAAAVAAIALSAVGGPVLVLIYGSSIADYTYLFPYVLAGTCLVALMWYLSDVLVICRDFKGMFIATTVAFAVCLATMVPLESLFGMNGINFVIIVAMVVGIVVSYVRLRSDIVKRAAGYIDTHDHEECERPNMQPIVSIVIPVYNSEKYLARCFNSILSQTYSHVEIVAVDDGSSDSSPRILSEYHRAHPGIFTVISQENQGAAIARNNGIAAAKGELITFADNDDYIDPDFIQTYVDGFSSDDIDIVCGGYRRPHATGKVSQEVVPDPQSQWALFVVEAAWAKVYRTEFLRKNGIEFLKTNICEDLYFTLPAVALAKDIKVLPYCGYNWFFNDESVSNTSQKDSGGLQFEYTLDSMIGDFNKRGLAMDDLYRHFFIRVIVWFLFFTGRGDDAQTVKSNRDRYRAWLDANIPDWIADSFARPSQPTGDALMNRVSVWLFVRYPRVFNAALKAYCAV